MVELLTAAQMRMIEKAAIDSGEVTGLELMERAGGGVVEAIYEEWPELAPAERGPTPSSNIKRGPAPAPPEYLGKGEEAPRRAVVLCGPGNNGGDGFVVARLLHRDGWVVEVFLYGDPDKLPADARRNYDRWCELGGVHDILMSPQDWPKALHSIGPDGTGVVVDALFGTGLSRPLETELFHAYSNFLSLVPVSFLPVVAVDIPTGMCSDSGRVLVNEDGIGVNWHVPLCVTFHRPKLAHFMSGNPVGRIVVKSIGLDDWRVQNQFDQMADLLNNLTDIIARDPEEMRANLIGSDLHQLSKPVGDEVWLVDSIPEEINKWGDHKFSHGHALILSGASGKTGAARLAARGALRIGAGLVTLGVPLDAKLEVASQITALMMCEVEAEQDLTDVLMDARINALCLGPGMGMDRARALLPVALNDPERHVVLDADALTAFADDPDALFAMLHQNCVLTPHGGEFARLFPDIAEKLNARPTSGPAYSKVDATRAAAKRAGCTVLFKGPDTVIASPDGSCAINAALYERAAPWLATAGSGDVLAGFITGLLARGVSPQSAAETAAWLHVECARTFGPGLIAEDLPEQLPIVFGQLIDQK